MANNLISEDDLQSVVAAAVFTATSLGDKALLEAIGRITTRMVENSNSVVHIRVVDGPGSPTANLYEMLTEMLTENLLLQRSGI